MQVGYGSDCSVGPVRVCSMGRIGSKCIALLDLMS